MTWFWVDDSLAFHRKAKAAGNAAMGLWVRAGSFSSQQLTDGFVDAGTVRNLGTVAQAKKLVDAGLWHAAGHNCGDCPQITEGYLFHEWHEDGDGTKRNFTREEVLERRRKRSEAGRRGGQRSGETRRGEANAKQVLGPDFEAKPNPGQAVRPGQCQASTDTQAPTGLRPYGAWTGKPQLLLVTGNPMSSTTTGNPVPRARANGQATHTGEPDVTSENTEDSA